MSFAAIADPVRVGFLAGARQVGRWRMDGRATDLIAKARAGETEALGELSALYRNYLRVVVRTGMGPKLRERVDLSDVVQEALVEVVRQFPQFTGQTEEALVGWLRRLVGQKLADLARYHNRIKRGAGETPLPLDGGGGIMIGPADSNGEAGGRLLDILAASQSSPSEVASRRELTVLLADALADLPETEAEVLWLYHADGLTFEAIGERLGLSRKSARAVWARGLKVLHRTLSGPPGGSLHYQGMPASHVDGFPPPTSLDPAGQV